MNTGVHFSSATDQWPTPTATYAALNDEFHFDFDPCPMGGTEDGLSTLFTPWTGRRVFCNPPYGPGIGKWLERGLEAELAVFLMGFIYLSPLHVGHALRVDGPRSHHPQSQRFHGRPDCEQIAPSPPHLRQTTFLSTFSTVLTYIIPFLIPARTDTRWFHDIVLPKAREVRFIRGRLKFGDAVSAAPFPSMVVVFGQ